MQFLAKFEYGDRKFYCVHSNKRRAINHLIGRVSEHLGITRDEAASMIDGKVKYKKYANAVSFSTNSEVVVSDC